MPESISFHFEGALADEHEMNFYEAARFQYAAARLMVKLTQFRKRGSFTQKITNSSNIDIRLKTQADGSFNINIDTPDQGAGDDDFIKISVADLIAYISERIIEKSDRFTVEEQNLDEKTEAELTFDQMFERAIAAQELTSGLPTEVKDAVKRRVAEIHRQQRLTEAQAAISKIDFVRSQKLISMSAPLISEMATALRKSAEHLEIRENIDGKSRSVLYLNRIMANEIETALVDKDITPILGDITQFNKDNGWGKIKIDQGEKILNFSIPSDILPSMKSTLIDSMQNDLVYLQTYCVRDAASEVIRLIAVGIIPTPEK